MRPSTTLFLLLVLTPLACEEKDPIEEAMEEMDLSIDTAAIAIDDATPAPEPRTPREDDGDASADSASSASPSVASGPTISEADVVAVVKRKKGAVQSCYEKELKGHPDLAGVVSVAWTVTANGGVNNVRIISNSTGNRDMESCIRRTIGGWAFPASHGAGVDIEYPFRFTPKLSF
jgi:TonB family protein